MGGVDCVLTAMGLVEVALGGREGHAMEFEIFEDRMTPGDWRVEMNDMKTGEGEVTIFSGMRARERAQEYADWRSSRLSSPRRRASA